MILEKLFIQNFLSIKSVSIELDNRGMILICGENKDNPDFQSNGAGKSSITEALTYVLYGKTIRGLKGDEVVNRISKRNCKVMLDLIDDDGTRYRVARYRKHQQQSNKFFLFCNGKDITPKAESDFTKAIVDLLQMDFMTFTSSILYSASSFKFTSATDSELKAAFDTMLGLDLYVNCQEETKAQLREVEREAAAAMSQIQMLKDKKIQLGEELENATQEAAEFTEKQKKKVNEYLSQLEELSTRKRTLGSEIAIQQETVRETEELLDEAKASRDKVEKSLEALRELEEEISNCKGLLSTYDKNLSKLKVQVDNSESKVAEYKALKKRFVAKIEKIQAKIEETQSTVGSPCPTCGAPLTEESLAAVISEMNEQITEVKQEMSEHQGVIDEQIQFQEDTAEKIQEIKDNQDQVQADLDGLEAVYAKSTKLKEKQQKIMSRISKAESRVSSESLALEKLQLQAGSIDRQIEEKTKLKQEAAEEENPYDNYVEKYKKQIDSTTTKLEDLEEDTKSLREQTECLQFWVQAYGNGGIKSLLLDDITPYLNRQANKFLRKLSSDHMEIKFSTQSELKTGEKREKFNIEVINLDGGASYSANSSGEKKRVDLAINLALQSLVSSRSNKKLNLIMLDEVLDSLDDSGIEHVMDLLSELSQEKSSIFVISHNDSIKSVFSETITIVKEGGYSTIKDNQEIPEE